MIAGGFGSGMAFGMASMGEELVSKGQALAQKPWLRGGVNALSGRMGEVGTARLMAGLGAAGGLLRRGAMAGIGGAAIGALSPWNTMGGGFRGAIGGGVKWGIGGGIAGAALGAGRAFLSKGGGAGIATGLLQGLRTGAKWGSMFGAAKGAVLGNRPMNPIYGLQY